MSRLWCIAAAIPMVAYLFLSVPVLADETKLETVRDLLASCMAHKQIHSGNSEASAAVIIAALQCRLFFQGFTEGHNMVLAWGRINGSVSDSAINELTMFCAPPDATVYSGIDKFLTWANVRPEEWDNFAGVGLGLALEHAWPCPKSF